MLENPGIYLELGGYVVVALVLATFAYQEWISVASRRRMASARAQRARRFERRLLGHDRRRQTAALQSMAERRVATRRQSDW